MQTREKRWTPDAWRRTAQKGNTVPSRSNAEGVSTARLAPSHRVKIQSALAGNRKTPAEMTGGCVSRLTIKDMGICLFESTNSRIYSSQGMSGADVYASLVIAKDAYGVTEIDGMGLKTYYQPLGSSGAVNDPLGQVGSIGWKCYHAAAILNQSWLLRLESGATP